MTDSLRDDAPPYDDPITPDEIPAQSQSSMPADEYKMDPEPDYMPRFPGVGKLDGKVALITGGDSGIGRAVSVLFAREGAKVAIAYLNEDKDAEETKRLVEAEGSEALLIPGDLGKKENANAAVARTVEHFGGLNILVNNAARQWVDEEFADFPEDKIRTMIETDVMSYLWCAQAAIPHLSEGDSIVNTTSVNAFHGHGTLLTYSTTKGANLAMSRSLAHKLIKDGIRVNAVAPGPIWTPFIPGSMPADKVEGFGKQVPMKRPGQPWEVATAYLFLASSDGNYYNGQTLHPNGGMVVGA